MTTTQEMQAQKKEAPLQVELKEDRPVYSPATDIYEKEDSLLVICDMPGVDEKQVDITLEDDVLTLTGAQQADEPADQSLIYRSYWSGVFRRSFRLSADIDNSKIKATMKNGVLHVLLPKAEKAQPRKIAVEPSN